MPVFELQAPNGKTYDVEAEDINHAAAAFNSDKSPAPPAGTEGLTPMQQWQVGMGEAAVKEHGNDVAKGVMRTPQTIAEGAGQLALGAAVGLGEATEAVTGIKGLAKKDVEKYTEYTDAVRELRKNVSPTTLNTAEAIGSVIPVGEAATLAPKAGGLLSALWQITKAGVKGGVVGATQAGTRFDESDKPADKLTQLAWGAAFPAAVNTVVAVPAVTRNALAAWLQKGESSRNADIRGQAEEFFKGSKAVPDPAPYTPAQQTGNPRMAALEQRARGPQMQELNATQLDQTRTRFDELADTAEQASGVNAGARPIARDTYKTVDVLDSQMRRDRNTEFELGMDEVKSLGAKSGATVPLNNLRTAYQTILADDANPFNVKGGSVPTSFRKALDLLNSMKGTRAADAHVHNTDFEAFQFNPGSNTQYAPTVENLAEIMKGLSQGVVRDSAILDPQQAQLERLRRQLWGALNKDIDAAAQGIPPGSVVPAGTRVLGVQADPAFQKLQEVRTIYARRSQRLDRLQDDSINQIFGSKEVLANPRAALERFYGLPNEDQVYATKILGQRAPGVLQAMRADRIRQSLMAATTQAGPAAQSTFDSARFSQEMFSGANAAGNSRLFSADQRKILQAGAAHLQILMNHLPGKGGGSNVWPEEFAINMISQNPAFISRIVTRAAYGKYGDELLGTPEGLEALRTFTRVGGPKSVQTAVAASWVLSKINKEEQQSDASKPK